MRIVVDLSTYDERSKKPTKDHIEILHGDINEINEAIDFLKELKKSRKQEIAQTKNMV